MSIIEEATYSTVVPMMGVFNNLVMYGSADQHGIALFGQKSAGISSIIRWRSGLTVVSVLIGSFS
jgi:hypothetical protein